MTPRLIDRVRTRLLAALVVLLAAAIVLAALGWYGMRSAQLALTGFQGEVLPNVTQALELAERTAKLAAMAPNVVESQSATMLDSNAQALRTLLEEIGRRVDTLGSETELGPRLRRLLGDVRRDLDQLVKLTRQRQDAEAAMQQQVATLDHIGDVMPAIAAAAGKGQPALAALWTELVVGVGADNAAKLGRLEADVEALWTAAHRRGGPPALPPSIEQALRDVAFGRQNVLSLRRQQLELERRTAYLVVLTRSNADQLSDDVGQYVTSLREQAAERRSQVQQAIRSGETAMLLLALGCILIAALATRYVRRFVGQIESITQVMSRLVAGDTAFATTAPTPAALRRDELGALARSFDVFRDALLAKQALVADLRTQSALLEAVHHNMTDALAVFDPQGALLLWNQRLADLFGRHGAVPETGMSPRALMQSLPAGSTWTAPGQTQPEPLPAGGEPDLTRFDHIELHLPDGHVYDLRSRAMPDGGTVTLATDLTARRAIERQEQHTQRLEVLGQLTGGVAHDFNNYLGTIIGNLGLLEAEGTLSPAAATQLQRARRAAGSAAALTRRLLAFARRQPLAAESVPVDAMVEEMRDLIEYSAGPQARVALLLQAGTACVHVDRGHLENALLNLVLNSAAAMPEGGELAITTRRAEAAVEIEVADTGTGIAEHLLDKVFEPFFTTKAPGEGSGLGLSIVYGFVRQSGGDISVSSTLGRGTRFCLRFPVAATAALPAQGAAPAAPCGAMAGLQMLVVDDDEAFRSTLTDMLRAAGVGVTEAAGGAAALQAVEQMPACDLVLTDVCLGGAMDGVQLANALHQRHPQLPLCLMSGMSFEPVLHRLSAGVTVGLLNKPFDLAALAVQIEALAVPAG
jgi:signal transduction histidine kinase